MIHVFPEAWKSYFQARFPDAHLLAELLRTDPCRRCGLLLGGSMICSSHIAISLASSNGIQSNAQNVNPLQVVQRITSRCPVQTSNCSPQKHCTTQG